MSRRSTSSIFPSCRVAAAAAALLLAGCAQLPAAGPVPQPKHAAAFQGDLAFAAAVARPREQWWLADGNPQFGALIEEGLAGAQARLRQAEAAVQVGGAATGPQPSANASASADRLSYNDLTPGAALAAATSELEAQDAELAQARLLLAASIEADYAELGRSHAGGTTIAQTADARLAAAEGAWLALDEQIVLQRHRLAALLSAGPDRGLAIARPAQTFERAFGLPATLAAGLPAGSTWLLRADR